MSADKVEASKQIQCCMEVICVANMVPQEKQYALILVAGGEEAFDRWKMLEGQVEDPNVPNHP